VWHRIPTDSNAQDAELEIQADGRMVYALLEGNKWHLMKLTYRLEGGFIVSNQASAPREERTRYSLQADGSLLLDFNGELSVFRRGLRRVPLYEQ
jgi:hypothetical protein